jgi:hypothetical protein
MSERLETPMPGSGGESSATMWQLPEDGIASVVWLLEEAGYDSSAKSIDRAIAGIHPIKLSPAYVETLSEGEQREYHYQQWIVEHGRSPSDEEYEAIINIVN